MSSKIDNGGDTMSVGLLSECDHALRNNGLIVSPRQPYPFPRIRKVCGGRVPMTMAAGFKYADGIMFCADSQITHGETLKTAGAKIAFNSKASDYSLVTTGAGHMGFLEWFFERIDASLAASDKSVTKAKQIIERALDELYKNHVSPYAKRHGTPDGEISMLIGFVGVEEGVSFWRTDSTALIEGTEVECVGSGSLAGMFFASKTYRDGVVYREALTIAANLLRQVKRFDPYVGGETSVMVLQNDGKVRREGANKIATLEAFLDECEYSAWDAILKCSNPSLLGEGADRTLEELCAKVRVSRKQLKPAPLPGSSGNIVRY